MGQAVTCVALGVMPDNALWEEIRSKLVDVDEYGYAEDWKKGLRLTPNAGSSMTDRMAVIGYVVALDGSADYTCSGARTDVPDLPLCASEQSIIRILGNKYVNRARKRWCAFAKWAERLGVKMPTPEFIVTQVEIA